MTTPHPTPGPPIAPGPRRGLVITTTLLALALIVSLTFNVLHITHPTGSSTDRSFASPREAAEFYVTALGQGKLDELVDAHASTTLVEHYDVKAEISQHGFIPVQNPSFPLPLQGEITTGLWTQQFRSAATTIVTRQVAVLTAIDEIDLEKPKKATPEEALTAFDATRLEGLQITQLRVVADHGPRGQALLDYLQEVFSPQGVTEVFIELSSGHLLSIVLTRYDNRWYITPTLGPLAISIGSFPRHMLAPAEEGEFETLVSRLEEEGIVLE